MTRYNIWFLLCYLYCGHSFAIGAEIDEDGYFEPRANILTRVQRIGILPLRLPSNMESREIESAYAEAALAKQLITAGFTIVPSQSYRTIAETMSRQLGGIYDPRTGDRDADKYSALRDHALRAFAEAEKLDGFAELVVQPSSAEFFGFQARFDGVIDRTNGKPKASGVIAALAEANDAQGTLSALSIRLDIRDVNRKPLYAGKGGVQLTAYINMGSTTSESAIVYVPTANLLRDLPRLDRAIDVATKNLRTTQAQRKAEEKAKQAAKRAKQPTPLDPTLPPLPEGIVEKRVEPFKVPRDEILRRIKTVAIMPIQLPFPEQSPEIVSRYSNAIATELARVGIRTVESAPLQQAWMAEIAKSTGFYDPFTGRHDAARESAARQAAYLQVGRQSLFDAVLWPTIVHRTVVHSAGIAKWDGVEQNAMFIGGIRPFLGIELPNFYGGKRSLPAMSLNIVLRSLEDLELYHSIGGIEVVERVASSPYDERTTPLAPSQMFSDVQRDRRAAQVAMQALVLTPQELDTVLKPATQQSNRQR